MVLCSEARQLVPDERGLEVDNFAVVDGMRLASPPCIGLTPMTGNLRCSRLHHIGRMDGLARYCVEYLPSLDKCYQLAPLGMYSRMGDNERGVGSRLAIDCPGHGRW